MFSNKWFSSLSIKTTAKKRKRTLSRILHDVLYHLPQHLPFKMAAKQSWTTRLTKCTCKACLAVNHPEIVLTLEECTIQGKIIVSFTWTEQFFTNNYAIFLDIFKLSHDSLLQKQRGRAYGWKLKINVVRGL